MIRLLILVLAALSISTDSYGATMMDKLQRLLQNRKATYVEKTPNDVYRDVGEDTGLSAEDVSAIGGLESQHGKYPEQLEGGSAQGLFQFQPKTAEFLDEDSSESLNNYDTQSKLMKLYLKKNDTDNVEDAFVKHNLGPGRGQKFMDAADNELISSVIPSNVIRANPGLYDVKTVGEARKKIKEKLNKGKESSEVRPNFLDLFKGE